MANGSPEEAVILQKPDLVYEKEKAAEVPYSSFEDWLRTDFKHRFRELHTKTGVHRDVEIAELSRDFSIGLWNLSRNRKLARKWSVPLYQAVFGDDKDSVVNMLGPSQQIRITEGMVGPISVCTFLDLIDKTRPELIERIEKDDIRQTVTEGHTDVKDRIDLILRFGDRNVRGQEIIRVVQLKSVPESDVAIVRISEPDRGYFSGMIEAEDSAKILARCERIAKAQNADVRAYGVLVPAYDSEAVSNVFGIIVPSTEDAKMLPGLFVEMAERQGLLPKRL